MSQESQETYGPVFDSIAPEAPFVTAIVRAHRRGPMLARALASIRGQARKDHATLVICDDLTDKGSRDAVAEARALGQRIQWADAEPLGFPACCENANMGPMLAASPWVVYLDDDDEFTDPMYFAHIGAASHRGVHVMISRFEYEGKPIPPDLSRAGIRCGQIGTSCIALRTWVAAQHKWTREYEADFRFIASVLAATRDDRIAWNPSVVGRMQAGPQHGKSLY